MKKLFVFSLFFILVLGVYAQTPANGQQGKAKVIFYYGRPVPIKNCMEQVGIQVDGATVHQIFQWHIWQTDVPAGIHVFSDDSHKDRGLTSSLVAGQTYYYELRYWKGFGFPKCDNFWAKVEDMKPKEIQKASALLGKPGIDETAATQSAAAAPQAAVSGQKLLVESIPDKADIEVDGSFRGNTPSAIELTAGDHTVIVSKTGYKPYMRTIKLAGGDVKLSPELEKVQ
jgi:PEGA domain-containing protein